VNVKGLSEYVYNKVRLCPVDSIEYASIVNIILKYLGFNDVDIILDKQIDDPDYSTIDNIVCRLKANEPIQYILSESYFMDLKLFVDKRVLIPRQETEEMVYNICKIDWSHKTIVDICTGSGCIALGLKYRYPSADIYGIDISSDTLEVAKYNSIINNLNVQWLQTDILLDIPQIHNVDLLIGNPPYIPNGDYVMKRVYDYEPHIALFVDNNDPLIFYRRIATIANELLNKQGYLCLEINDKYSEAILDVFKKFKNVILQKDMNNKYRWIICNI
jgi:release factor glutamine methyltransferase